MLENFFMDPHGMIRHIHGMSPADQAGSTSDFKELSITMKALASTSYFVISHRYSASDFSETILACRK
ncbi:MAG: hypothetical protein M2R45_05273 [Verrucomicrobia subdivision 3 bacterium]|nr:hypothetical protein [Limisphaerales bacterium]MCS1417471.1 hypothetical protein [Limisphaerales bacterium]